MNHKIYKYIQTHFSQQPKSVDKLIVTTFLKKNKLKIKNNKFLKKYLIHETNVEITNKLDEFISLLDLHFKKLDIEALIELFEFVISPSDRIITGAVYTPNKVREFIVTDILNKIPKIPKSWKACDIACGCGGFLYTVTKNIRSRTSHSFSYIYQNHIYGLDIKSYSIDRTKILLTLFAIYEGEDKGDFDFNLYTGDALDFDWNKKLKGQCGFDAIVGNPPYVCSKRIDVEIKKKLSNYSVSKSGHPDLYIPFFQIGLELLKPDGFLGFITMNSFFKSLNGRELRAYFQVKKYSLKIIDFGTLQVFQKRSTYTCVCIFQNQMAESLQYKRLNEIGDLNRVIRNFSNILYSSLNAHSGWNLIAINLINTIEKVGQPFAKRFKTRNGIATLKNEIYIFKSIKEDRNFYYYYYDDNNIFPIEKGICKEIINPNKLVGESNLKELKEKFIFPYTYIDGKAVIMTAQLLIQSYPCTYRYLLFVKNVLDGRDKGKGKYPKWFAFGRTQSLEKLKFKLFFPHISPGVPNFIISQDEDLYFYNGIAVIGDNRKELKVLIKLMSSRLFWFYIKNTSKPYSASYFSLSKNYIKDFGVYKFNDEEMDYIIGEDNYIILNRYFEEKYQITLPD